MPGIRSAEKHAYVDSHEFREHRATLQMGSAAVLQRSHFACIGCIYLRQVRKPLKTAAGSSATNRNRTLAGPVGWR